MIIRTLLRIAEMTGHCRLYGRGRGNAPPLPGSVPLPLLRKNFIQRMGQNRHVNGLGAVSYTHLGSVTRKRLLHKEKIQVQQPLYG